MLMGKGSRTAGTPINALTRPAKPANTVKCEDCGTMVPAWGARKRCIACSDVARSTQMRDYRRRKKVAMAASNASNEV